MPDMYFDVDTAITEAPVNVMPLLDDTDFKTREVAIVYNQAGMDLVWNFVTSAGVFTQTAVTPTTAGVYDWTHQGDGIYTIEIPASGGASINNDTEGYGWFTGICTGVLAWRGPVIGFRAAALNDALLDGGDNLDVNVAQWLGTAVATPTVAGVPEVDVTHVSGTAEDIFQGDDEANLVDLIFDEPLTGHTTNQTTGKVLKGISEGWIAVEGSVNDASATTTSFVTDLTETTDSFYKDQPLVFISGTLAGQSRIPSAYNGTSKTLTFDEAFTSAPANTDQFIILATHIHAISEITADIDANSTSLSAIETDTQDIQSRLPAALVSGKMDSDMAAISGSTTAADNLEASALGIVPGACEGTPTTTVIQTNLGETTDDHYIGRIVVFTSGAAAGQATDITDYTGATGTITVTALTTAPSATDTFVVI